MPSKENEEDRKSRAQFPRGHEEIQPDAFIRTIKNEQGFSKKDQLQNIPVTPGNYSKFKGNKRAPLPKGIAWALAGLAALFVIGSVVSFYVVRGEVMQTVATQTAALQKGVQDLQNLDPQSAAQEFSSLQNASSGDAIGFMSIFGSLFKGGGDAVSAFGSISVELTNLSTNLVSLETSGFGFLSTGNGSTFVADLTNIRNSLDQIDALSEKLTPFAGASILPLKTQLQGTEQFLNAFTPWISASAPHHFLILLDNPSELRPGGGFLGSYADVTIASATITNIAVHDVADVDTAFAPNIIPPKPLQLEGPRFRPADANWFFDFPTSASETIAMFQASALYATTSFDGAIALTPKVVSDLLTVTGPVTISTGPKASTTFTSDNLVVQIQKIVQAGQASAATYPKSVLNNLGTAIFTKISSSTDDQKQELFAMALDWIAKKEVTVYFKNPAMEQFVDANEGSGDVYQLPGNFNGDYLAVANADINSDKSELYVAQDIDWQISINPDNTATDHLIITRKHTGNKSPYSWYKTTNQDYMQVFVPAGSSLTNESGGFIKTIAPAAIYADPKNGYSADPLVQAIESTTASSFSYPAVAIQQEFGKQVFAVWDRTYAGSSTVLSFDYSHHLFAPAAAGEQYQFVFEKQPGEVGSYEFEINAPLGYAFEENGLPTFDYTSDDPPGRLIISLTLEKI